MQANEMDFGREATAWISNAAGLSRDLTVELCPGGRSNLTYRIRDTTGASVILRRPPAGMVLPTAHDMGREFRFLTALAPTGFPVPQPIALCEDESLIGVRFYLMRDAKGLIVRGPQEAKVLTRHARAAIGPNLITTLAHLHSFETDTLGLHTSTDPRAYLSRQLNRWMTQVSAQAATATTFPDGVIHNVVRTGTQLGEDLPETTEIGIVHGDFRLDNVVIDPAGGVRAVLDWEIAAIGDTLADIGIFGVYWTDPGDSRLNGINAATLIDGFAQRTDLLALYAELREIDPARIDYYQRFGSWKLACILIGVVERYRHGASGGDSSSVEDYPSLIDELLGAAQR